MGIYTDDIFTGGLVEPSADVKARGERVAAEEAARHSIQAFSRPSRASQIGVIRPRELRRRGFRPPTPHEKAIGVEHWLCSRHPILWIPGKGEFRPHRRRKEIPDSAEQLSGRPRCKRCWHWRRNWGRNDARRTLRD